MDPDPISGGPIVSVVIPARDEEETLPHTLPLVVEDLARLPVATEVVVVVPDCSPFAHEPPLAADGLAWATVGVPGKYEALRVGVGRASGEVLVFIDADVVLRPGAISALVEPLLGSSFDVVAGRIVLQEQGGSVVQRALEAWTSISVEAWHRLRSERPELRWALPGALYGFRRQWFPDTDLLVPVLDDASIGTWMAEQGARIGYAPQAQVRVGAARSLRQWYHQKRRIRRGWHELRAHRPDAVSDLQRSLSTLSKSLCQGRPGAHLLRLTDRGMAVVAESSRLSPDDRSGAWRPDRAGWRGDVVAHGAAPVKTGRTQLEGHRSTSGDLEKGRAVE